MEQELRCVPLPSSSGRPSPGPNILVIRAAFVPEGQQPPPEFSSVFDPLHFPATLDPATGMITCDNAGISFLGDIRAEWRPDGEQSSDNGEDAAAQGSNARGIGGADEAPPDEQRDRTSGARNQPVGGTWPARSRGRTPFGLAGDGSGGGSASSKAMPDRASTGQDGGDPAVEQSREVAAKSDDNRQDGSIPPTDAERQSGSYGRPGYFDDAVKQPFGQFARAARKTATDADAADGDGRDAAGTTRSVGQPAALASSADIEPVKRTDRPGPAPPQAADTANQGVEVQLPNGQNIPDSYSPTGKLMSPVADLSAVAEAGRQTRETYLSLLKNPETALGAVPYLAMTLNNNVGQGGTFDYQRKGNRVAGFTQFRQFRDVADVNVGLFAQQAGLTLEETLFIAGKFAKIESSNARPKEPHGLEPRTAEFMTTGFNLGQSGAFGKPTTP